ncbi:MAG: prolyl-tRNA synthetase associated domain-containing protein [Faecalibacillus sp.]
MNKYDIDQYLQDRQIQYEMIEHQAVMNMEDLAHINIPYPEAEAKNLFVRDDKKRHYYLISVKGKKKVDLKMIRERYKTRSLSFASKTDLMEMMQLSPGAVTPFGLLHDNDLKIQYFIDQDFCQESGIIGVHPNDNTATVFLKTTDLLKIIKEHGQTITIVEI